MFILWCKYIEAAHTWRVCTSTTHKTRHTNATLRESDLCFVFFASTTNQTNTLRFFNMAAETRIVYCTDRQGARSDGTNIDMKRVDLCQCRQLLNLNKNFKNVYSNYFI